MREAGAKVEAKHADIRIRGINEALAGGVVGNAWQNQNVTGNEWLNAASLDSTGLTYRVANSTPSISYTAANIK